jgi:serine/threonine-protein kinase HSL1 (negative regulator of Swe1 kinase)
LKTRCGSEEYAAPEIIIGKPYHGERVDVWSFGIIIFACLYGHLPFYKTEDIPVNSDDRRALFNQILFAPLHLPGLSPETEELLSSLLNRQDYKRLNFNDLDDKLKSNLLQ